MILTALVAFLIVAAGAAVLISAPKYITAAALAAALASAALLAYMLHSFTDGLVKIERLLNQPQKLKSCQLSSAADKLRNLIVGCMEQASGSGETLENENRQLNLQIQLLQRRKASVEAILHSIRDGVLVTDARGLIVLANETAGKLLGFSFDPENPCTLDEAVADEPFREKISKSIVGGIRHVRHELTFPTGIYEGVFSCIFDDKGAACGAVAVLHDVTREKETARMKNEFVSHVSHELKTPLASINAYAEMLVDGEAQNREEITQFCSIIQGQAERLNRLIEDILNISRIESGLVKVSRSSHSIALLIRDAVEMIRSYAQEKNITIDAQAPILYDQAYVDKDMISQVIINLLSNAVKYTPAGGTVTIESQVNEADGWICVTVSDTGVGIPPEDLDHIFDKFYRVEANKKIAKGTGLGLNLVKQIVETVHEGRIFVRSTVGKGSTFGFELPLGVPQAAAGRA